jgi:hypothetical protein
VYNYVWWWPLRDLLGCSVSPNETNKSQSSMKMSGKMTSSSLAMSDAPMDIYEWRAADCDIQCKLKEPK